MTPDPTLTDEELAEIEARRRSGVLLGKDVPRLIAALRAICVENERLIPTQAGRDAKVEHLLQINQDLAGRNGELSAEVDRLRREVEELAGGRPHSAAQ